MMVLKLFIKKEKMMILQTTEILNSHIHTIWENVFFYLLIVIIILFISSAWILMKALRKKNIESKLLQQQHIARIDNIRKEHSKMLNSLRVEMLKREDDRIRQWMESEKETLHVLNGVSTLLELSDKVDKAELKKINKMLQVIETKLNDGKNRKT